MKKSLGILALSLLLPATVCFAASALPDLTEYKTEELYTLQSSIISELLSRSEISEFDVPVGSYIVGEDLPAGNYIVTVTDSFGTMITVNEYEQVYSISPEEKIGKLVLADGDHLKVDMCGAIFSPYTGLAISK